MGHALITFLFIHALLQAQTPPQTKTVWDGVYSSSQAARGKESYETFCSRCHDHDLTGGVENPPLKGNLFLGNWMEDNLTLLFQKMRTMPPDGRKPPEDVHLDILASILEANTFPAGQQDLKSDVLANVLLTGKNGPAPVPDFALVQVVGCLAQNATGNWTLTNASEPIRSRNPDKPTDEELKKSAATPLGKHTFLLLSPTSFKSGFPIDSHKGAKMQGKGLLIRTRNDERLNVTWLEQIDAKCS